jgi:hypothetical protein
MLSVRDQQLGDVRRDPSRLILAEQTLPSGGE